MAHDLGDRLGAELQAILGDVHTAFHLDRFKCCIMNVKDPTLRGSLSAVSKPIFASKY